MSEEGSDGLVELLISYWQY